MELTKEQLKLLTKEQLMQMIFNHNITIATYNDMIVHAVYLGKKEFLEIHAKKFLDLFFIVSNYDYEKNLLQAKVKRIMDSFQDIITLSKTIINKVEKDNVYDLFSVSEIVKILNNECSNYKIKVKEK